MSDVARYQDHVLRERITRPRQVALVSGPRQVGKTTPCRALASGYLDWDSLEDRQLILRGPKAVAEHFAVQPTRGPDPVVVFDNLRAYRKWRVFLRGFHESWGGRSRVIVTGNTALESASSPGANYPFRFFSLRMHPWSVGECVRAQPSRSPVQPPVAIEDADWNALLEHGGFPEPFLKRDSRFTRRWQLERRNELLQRDLRELTTLRDLATAQMLVGLLSQRSAAPLSYSQLSRELAVAVDTVRRWVGLLIRLQFGFSIRPWSTRVAKAVRREPKWFLRDWSGIADPAARERTFVACHLLKAVEGWTDRGLGEFDLRYVRDKLRREVDFLVVRGRKPWFLVEVGTGRGSDSLRRFQQSIRAPHAFHVVLDSPFVAADCFEGNLPAVVPARTLLSQLL